MIFLLTLLLNVLDSTPSMKFVHIASEPNAIDTGSANTDPTPPVTTLRIITPPIEETPAIATEKYLRPVSTLFHLL